MATVKEGLMNKEDLALAVKKVFDACRDLSKLSGDVRNCPPDGRLVGDIGELIAACFYQVDLYSTGFHDWDGKFNGRHVQVRATAKEGTYLKPVKDGCGDGLLMVFKIDGNNGTFETVYNGDLQRALDKYGHLTGNVSLKRFRELQKAVDPKDIVPER
jgi:hypothetical protein